MDIEVNLPLLKKKINKGTKFTVLQPLRCYCLHDFLAIAHLSEG